MEKEFFFSHLILECKEQIKRVLTLFKNIQVDKRQITAGHIIIWTMENPSHENLGLNGEHAVWVVTDHSS